MEMEKMSMTLTASVHARWGHRVDGLIHTHAWIVEATVGGPADSGMVFPADDLEEILTKVVEPWSGRYLTDVDVGRWKRLEPLMWDREPTVEEIARRLWSLIEPQVPDLREIALVESTEFDRCRTVRLKLSGSRSPEGHANSSGSIVDPSGTEPRSVSGPTM